MKLAADELEMPVIERTIDRSELYVADECFMTGTAAEITPIGKIDRRQIGEGPVGPYTAKLKKLFEDVVRGNNKKYCRGSHARLAKVDSAALVVAAPTCYNPHRSDTRSLDQTAPERRALSCHLVLECRSY